MREVTKAWRASSRTTSWNAKGQLLGTGTSTGQMGCLSIPWLYKQQVLTNLLQYRMGSKRQQQMNCCLLQKRSTSQLELQTDVYSGYLNDSWNGSSLHKSSNIQNVGRILKRASFCHKKASSLLTYELSGSSLPWIYMPGWLSRMRLFSPSLAKVWQMMSRCEYILIIWALVS